MNTGSLQNLIADQSTASAQPEVGMGATIISWTDRSAATIVAVSRTGHEITAQCDRAIRTDDRGMSDAQTYRYERDPSASRFVASRRRDGSYRIKGSRTRVLVGVRDHYHDYSF